MRVHVPDSLPRVLAGVEDDPVPGGLDALGGRDLACRRDEFVKQPAARGGEGRHVGVMIPRHHQDMRRRLRVDVTEGDSPLPVQHKRGRDLSGSDPAEQAVWHITIIVGTGSCAMPDSSADRQPVAALAPGRRDLTKRGARRDSPHGDVHRQLCEIRRYATIYWPVTRTGTHV
jgi:hypothetical protein